MTTALCWTLALSFWAAFGGGNYVPGLFITEVFGAGLSLVYVMLLANARMTRRRFWRGVVPGVLLLAWIIIYASMFALNTGAPVLPSILAQRDLVFVLLAPVIYLLWEGGVSVATLESAFMRGAFLTVLTYCFAMLALDLPAWAQSADPSRKMMVAFDVARGYRLKGPQFMCLMVGLHSLRRVLAARRWATRFMWLMPGCAAGTVLLVNISRSTLAAWVAGMLISSLFLGHRRHFKLLVALAPIVLAALVGAISLHEQFFSPVLDAEDWSYIARMETGTIALKHFLASPLFGFGVASYQSLSFHDPFGPMFYPGDVGVLGLLFQFGLVGTLCYIAYCWWLVRRVVATAWERVNTGSGLFARTLMATCVSIVIASPLQTQLLGEDGLPIAAFAWAWVLATSRQRSPLLRTVSDVSGWDARSQALSSA